MLVGPVNYLVLSRIDRREWAWVTVPALIGVFTIGAFAIGSLLRGSDVIVHEVAIVRGAPGTDQATAQSYLGIFSPSRATYQLRVDGDALLATPMNGDIFGGGTGAGLDVLQGDPSRVRDLEVGFGSLRTIRAEASATGPTVDAALRLEDGEVTGTVTNRSERTLESPALVLGGSAVTARRHPARRDRRRDVRRSRATRTSTGSRCRSGSSGPMSFDGSSLNEIEQRRLVRRSVIDQLSYDPMTGVPVRPSRATASSCSPGARTPSSPPRSRASRCATWPTSCTRSRSRSPSAGPRRSRATSCGAASSRRTSNFFSRDPWSIQLGTGDVRIAWRPIPFDGTFDATKVVVALSNGGELTMPGGNPVAAEEKPRCDPAADGCVLPQDALPDIEVLDIRTGSGSSSRTWPQSRPYELADPARWVDPASGEIQVRFVNERPDPVYFQFLVAITGDVR